jgi:hypothetical protein
MAIVLLLLASAVIH